MSNAIDVSVVVCVRNGAATIQRQLDALDAQIEHPPFEVVVVDNGSADGTADLVRQWVGQPVHAAERITLVSSGPAPGIPHARNIGCSNARDGSSRSVTPTMQCGRTGWQRCQRL
ncbi:glycosyltransferase family 2 protein [Helcobacillus sp. ACRRO]|uniref:glycosyltransferase family 2 protein n=1 Tax=Helcobacillus sp. ACRRO TaxID=2918202 RepID=UPI001EF62AB9|nr:glycosyltransferase family A protein [Helcobacillus sp. ACRRO]MCG7427175.1 glycosyltransferase family 2 protein [Helcobacillus sp. ACRRO]